MGVSNPGYVVYTIYATAVLQNLAKNSNVNFSACVKFHVKNEWEILRMCEIIDCIDYSGLHHSCIKKVKSALRMQMERGYVQ